LPTLLGDVIIYPITYKYLEFIMGLKEGILHWLGLGPPDPDVAAYAEEFLAEKPYGVLSRRVEYSSVSSRFRQFKEVPGSDLLLEESQVVSKGPNNSLIITPEKPNVNRGE